MHQRSKMYAELIREYSDYLDHVPQTGREKIQHFLHSSLCHIAVLILVLLDCGLVIAEIILDAKITTYEDYCTHTSNPTPACVADEDKAHHWEHAAHATHLTSIVILSIFMVEVIMKIYFTYDHFIKHKVEILDAIVVFISFVLDLIFLDDDTVGGVVGKNRVKSSILFNLKRFADNVAYVANLARDQRVHTRRQAGS